MLDKPLSLVGRFIKVRDDVLGNYLGTYLVIGIIIKRPSNNKRLSLSNTYILQESNSKRLYFSYISFSSDSTEYFTVAIRLRTGASFRGFSVVNTEMINGEIDRVLALTSKEQRLDFARRAVKHIQWRYAKIVYSEKSFFNKLPRYRQEMKWVLDPYFNPDKYIEKII